MEWITENWQFLVGDILVPIITLIIGYFIGKNVERRKAKSKIIGNDNQVYQNCDGKKKTGKKDNE